MNHYKKDNKFLLFPKNDFINKNKGSLVLRAPIFYIATFTIDLIGIW